jgi:hypothetical protein
MTTQTQGTISFSRLEEIRRNVTRTAEAAVDFAEWLDGATALKLSYEATGDSGWIPRQEPSDPTTDAYQSSNYMASDGDGRHAKEYSVTLYGSKDGARRSVCLGDYIERPANATEAAQNHLESLQHAAAQAAKTFAAVEALLNSGERVVVSPTQDEEQDTARAEAARKANRAAQNKGLAARQALHVYLRDEAKYRANGHDIDSMIAAARQTMQEGGIRE